MKLRLRQAMGFPFDMAGQITRSGHYEGDMNVVFDISILGLGHRSSSAKTGIFRVTENLAKEMSKIKDMNLHFSSMADLETVFYAREYFESHLHSFPGVQLIDMTNAFQRSLRRKTDLILRSLDPEAKRKSDVIGYKVLDKLVNYINVASLFLSANYHSQEKILSRIDIFHAFYFPIPYSVKKMPNIKKFITIYDLIPVLTPQYVNPKLTKWFNKKVLNSIDQETNILCISEFTKSDLCHYLPHIDPRKVTVTYLAVSDLFYPASKNQMTEVRKKYHLPEGEYFLSLCTLEPRKNLEHVIRCFMEIIEEKQVGSDLFLVLAGAKGWHYSKIFNEILHSKFSDRIILTGYIEERDLAPLYSGAIGFIYPSLYEGFGLPPLEAMQCGTPVITSNTTSLPEVVGDAGIMVDPRDGDELCQQMINLYRNLELRKKLSEKAIQRAKQFSWERCARETVAAYKEAL